MFYKIETESSAGELLSLFLLKTEALDGRPLIDNNFFVKDLANELQYIGLPLPRVTRRDLFRELKDAVLKRNVKICHGLCFGHVESSPLHYDNQL